MKKNKYTGLIMIFCTILLCTGCKQDDMENIDIIVTNYASEYITSELYGKHAKIDSIYPDGVKIADYNITKKQKRDYSKKGLFIYNGMVDKERSLAIDLLDLNGKLKIIDTAYVLEEKYSVEELWLNPSSLLMMAKNVQIGLDEYITNSYLKKEIDDSYDKLKVILSELDANYRVAVQNTKDTVIVANSPSLKYLEKFGINVICIDNNATDKTLNEVEDLILNGTIRYIYNFKDNKLSNNANNLLKKFTDLKELNLHKLDNLTDKEREEKKNYVSIMNDNLELLKQELYQ